MDFETVSYDAQKNSLVILDQTLLPGETVFLSLTSITDIYEAILNLRVRGAPAIGVAAAIAMAVLAQNIKTADSGEFALLFMSSKKYLESSRPTAVNLFWALNQMEQVVRANTGATVSVIKELLLKKALEIKENDIAICRSIGENGLNLVENGDGIFTHCNAGRLAAVKYGTALAPVYVGAEKGYAFRVFADETRPLLQGARLTAWELSQAGIDTTLLCDNMVSSLMKRGNIHAVFVGADRIASNGDTANKIGTSGVAVLAKHYGIPFYVFAPESTIDTACKTGSDIVIEQRMAAEVTDMWYKTPVAPKGVAVYNPAFDITEAGLITAIVTEKGIYKNLGGVVFGGSETVYAKG